MTDAPFTFTDPDGDPEVPRVLTLSSLFPAGGITFRRVATRDDLTRALAERGLVVVNIRELADAFGYEEGEPTPPPEQMFSDLCTHRKLWCERDGNTPGYSNEKAKCYGAKAAEFKQQVEQLTARVVELEARNGIAETYDEADLKATSLALEDTIRERDEARAELKRVKADRDGWKRAAESQNRQWSKRYTEATELRAELEKQHAMVEAARSAFGPIDASVPEPEGKAHYASVPVACIRALAHALASAGSEPKREEP